MSLNNLPTRTEIIGLLNEHKGTVHVWRTLKAKYGNPKNSYGGFVRMVILEQSVSNAGIKAGVHAPVNAPSNAQSNANESVPVAIPGSKTVGAVEHYPTSIQTSAQANANVFSDFEEYIQFCEEYGLNPWSNHPQTVIYAPPAKQQPADQSWYSFMVEILRESIRLRALTSIVRMLNP
jgi:hypothetical protein